MGTQYCTEADIVDNLKGVTFSASTSVTTDGLTKMIAEESATIDSKIMIKYDLPISGSSTDALIFLRKIAIALVVYRVVKVLQAKNALPVPDVKTTQEISVGQCYRDAMRLLHDISKGDAGIPDLETSGISNVRSTAVDCDEQFTFVGGEQQW